MHAEKYWCGPADHQIWVFITTSTLPRRIIISHIHSKTFQIPITYNSTIRQNIFQCLKERQWIREQVVITVMIWVASRRFLKST